MKISVIIPVYNAEKYLRKCLDSVCNQTYADWEVIAVDDGSKDNSYKILQEYAEKDSRFIVETKKNEGPGLTRNRALEKASGNYVVFLDSDDYIEKDYFELLVMKYKETGSEVIFIDVIQEDPKGKVIRYERMSDFKFFDRKGMISCQMTGFMPWGGWRKACSRQLIEREHLRYTEDTVGEEAIFSFELLRNANDVVFIEKPLYHYINHPGSQSKNPNGTWSITLKKMEEHLKEKRILEEYREGINSFAFVVLISWLLKFSKLNSLLVTFKEFGARLNRFRSDYGSTSVGKYTRKEIALVYRMLQYHLTMLVVLAARMVRR